MSFLNNIISFCAASRLKAIQSFSAKADVIQDQQLKSLLLKARNTQFGQSYHFDQITSYAEFAERVPVVDYEGFVPYVDRMLRGETDVAWLGKIRWFAKSSGTTNAKSKFIPITSDALQKCHYRGSIDAVLLYLQNVPQSHMLSGKCLTLGGSREISQLNKSSKTGDLSAILLDNAPRYSNLVKTPPRSIALLSRWEEKLEKITKATMHENVTSLAGVPSWFLILLKHMMNEAKVDNIQAIWPNLELFMHGGVSFTPYREQYNAIAPKGLNYMEMYNASEGFFAMQSDLSQIGMEIMLDYGIFYEFVPLAELGENFPHARRIHEVELGVDYAIVITTNGGLWRYLIGDTVRFVSLAPFKVIISGRTKHYINAFGEELMVDNAEKALAKACEQTGAVIREYTAAPVFMSGTQQGCHQWLVEFEKQPSSAELFVQCLDKALQAVNSDYEAKRYKDITLGVPKLTIANDGLFFNWMKQKGKLGGQNKVPRLANTREIIDSLLELNN